MPDHGLSSQAIKEIIYACNKGVITDWNYDPEEQYPSAWFKQQFDFLDNPKLSEQLGDALYQARFVYQLMATLKLKMNKNKGLLKFQIIQYASICEALLDWTLKNFFEQEFQETYAAEIFTPIPQALAADTKITQSGVDLTLCKIKKEKAKIAYSSSPIKAGFAADKGIISSDTKERYCNLYDLRNNAHLLKATDGNYFPKPIEAQNAYELMWKFVGEAKKFILSKKTGAEAV